MRTRRLSGSLLAGASVLLLSGAAFAQQPDPQQQQEPQVQQEQQLQQQQMQQPAAGEGMEAQLSSDELAELQRMLNNAGYDAGAVDGIWGPQTSGAVENFQQDRGLEPTGRLTAETLQALGMEPAAGMGMPEGAGGVGMPGEQPGMEAEQPTQPQQ
jgi:peptidoglycan hydrolase-like protein with peptidoglycan-binding domain